MFSLGKSAEQGCSVAARDRSLVHDGRFAASWGTGMRYEESMGPPGLALLALPGRAGCVRVLDSLLFFAFVRKRPTDKVNTGAFHTRRPLRSIRIRRGPGVLSPETEMRRVRWAQYRVSYDRCQSRHDGSSSIASGVNNLSVSSCWLWSVSGLLYPIFSAHSVSCRRGLGQKQRAGRRPRPMRWVIGEVLAMNGAMPRRGRSG